MRRQKSIGDKNQKGKVGKVEKVGEVGKVGNVSFKLTDPKMVQHIPE